ncbi:asparaginase [uncultured Senegalimassilia sp.]|uniref:asparaginase n=1 Tax=uncultured Senegalimassilia sp. TaxID=1714350 RepID=UPI002590D1A7|nr:asparaginase [uncultured Senegalimassilia sp.]
MKRVLVIATGGTIASAEEGSGLAPALTGEQLVAFVPEVAQMCHAEVSQVMNVDSTNMRPEGWLAIAGEVRRRYDDFDGFAVLHGTDTLAYTAAGLSYLVQRSPKPVVLTGSQLPMGDPGTDGKRNLLDAVCVACDDSAAGVLVAFGGKVIAGTAARKVRTRDFEAFDSLNVPDLGVVGESGVQWATGARELMALGVADGCAPAGEARAGREGFSADGCSACEEHGGVSVPSGAAERGFAVAGPSAPRFFDTLNPRVMALKVTPGMDGCVIDALRPLCDALVVEAFGLGGIPEYAGVTDALLNWADADKTLVMTTQCPFEGADLSVYEVGRAFCNRPGVFMGGAATTEALLAKTMWALAQAERPDGTIDREKLTALFASC